MASQLFDPDQADAARDEAINRVDRHMPLDWKDAAIGVVRVAAEMNSEFTTDLVWAGLEVMGIDPPHEQRALGAVMVSAARKGWISKTDRMINSRRRQCHARPVAVWKSLIVEAGK